MRQSRNPNLNRFEADLRQDLHKATEALAAPSKAANKARLMADLSARQGAATPAAPPAAPPAATPARRNSVTPASQERSRGTAQIGSAAKLTVFPKRTRRNKWIPTAVAAAVVICLFIAAQLGIARHFFKMANEHSRLQASDQAAQAHDRASLRSAAEDREGAARSDRSNNDRTLQVAPGNDSKSANLKDSSKAGDRSQNEAMGLQNPAATEAAAPPQGQTKDGQTGLEAQGPTAAAYGSETPKLQGRSAESSGSNPGKKQQGASLSGTAGKHGEGRAQTEQPTADAPVFPVDSRFNLIIGGAYLSDANGQLYNDNAARSALLSALEEHYGYSVSATDVRIQSARLGQDGWIRYTLSVGNDSFSYAIRRDLRGQASLDPLN